MTGPARTIALIGATSGLGRAAADQLAQNGHNLILVGRDPQRVQWLAKQLPNAVVIGADISTIAGVNHAATRDQQRCRSPRRAPQQRSSSESYDNDVARRLWEATEALRGPFGQ